jgi:hypothetical protein
VFNAVLLIPIIGIILVLPISVTAAVDNARAPASAKLLTDPVTNVVV